MTDDTIDLTESCPFCRKNLESEDHDARQCFHAAYKMIITANADYERIAHRINMDTGEPIVRNRKRIRDFLRYEIPEIGRSIRLFIEIIALFYLIQALQRFIEFGL